MSVTLTTNETLFPELDDLSPPPLPSVGLDHTIYLTCPHCQRSGKARHFKTQETLDNHIRCIHSGLSVSDRSQKRKKLEPSRSIPKPSAPTSSSPIVPRNLLPLDHPPTWDCRRFYCCVCKKKTALTPEELALWSNPVQRLRLVYRYFFLRDDPKDLNNINYVHYGCNSKSKPDSSMRLAAANKDLDKQMAFDIKDVTEVLHFAYEIVHHITHVGYEISY